MTSISSASTLIYSRPINEKDILNVKQGSIRSSQPLLRNGIPVLSPEKSAPLLSVPTQEQQASAKQVERQQEAYARMRVLGLVKVS